MEQRQIVSYCDYGLPIKSGEEIVPSIVFSVGNVELDLG